MFEYKILRGTPDVVEEDLNNLHHMYRVEIVTMAAIGDRVIILIKKEY